MEGLTRLVSESLARYGLDRPVDYRRLQWSPWFRCESLRSLLQVPSQPGVFALAEEVMDFGSIRTHETTQKVHVRTAALGCPGKNDAHSDARSATDREGRDFIFRSALSQRSASKGAVSAANLPASAAEGRRILSVLQFYEAHDMAHVLARMLSPHNPVITHLASGRCFLRFVAIDDQAQRRSICNALNQWLVSTSETITGIGAHFAASQEFTVGEANPAEVSAERTLLSANANPVQPPGQAETLLSKAVTPKESLINTSAVISSGAALPVFTGNVAESRNLLCALSGLDRSFTKPDAAHSAPVGVLPHLDSGAATNIHCPHPIPSGF